MTLLVFPPQTPPGNLPAQARGLFPGAPKLLLLDVDRQLLANGSRNVQLRLRATLILRVLARVQPGAASVKLLRRVGPGREVHKLRLRPDYNDGLPRHIVALRAALRTVGSDAEIVCCGGVAFRITEPVWLLGTLEAAPEPFALAA